MSPVSGKLAAFARAENDRGKGKVVLPAVQQYLAAKKPDARDPWHCHPSEMAKKDWCPRGTFYRIQTGKWPVAKQGISFTLQSIFDEGHQIHDKWQSWLKQAGVLWGDWCCSACGERVQGQVAWELDDRCGWAESDDHDWRYEEVSLEHGLIKGHEDGAIGDRLIEFKSLGLGSLRHENPELLARFYKETTEGHKLYDVEGIWTALSAPLKSHVRQANIYLYLAGQMGLGMTACSIVYEYKPNQQAREFVIPLSQSIIAPMLDKVDQIATALEKDQPGYIPRCPSGGCPNCRWYE
jgi:hypothetical protein